MIRTLISLLGFACLVMGLLWVGQGLNLIDWPAGSFMVGVRDWALRGSVMILAGLLMIWFARRT